MRIEPISSADALDDLEMFRVSQDYERMVPKLHKTNQRSSVG
jgi:hypothetical protein